MAEAKSYYEYEVTGDAGPDYPPYHWHPTTLGIQWDEEKILATAHVISRSVADLVVRRRRIVIHEWEEVDYDRT